MATGPGKWPEQGVFVLSSLEALSDAVEELKCENEALRRMVYKVAGFMVAAGVGGKAGVDFLIGMF